MAASRSVQVSVTLAFNEEGKSVDVVLKIFYKVFTEI